MHVLQPQHGGGGASPSPTQTGMPAADVYEDVVDIRDILDTILAGKWIIAAIAFISLCAGTIHAILGEPIYEADALVQIEDKRGSLPGLELLTDSFGSHAVSEVEIEIINSRFVLGEVVDRLDLQTRVEPLRFPVVGSFLARRHIGEEPALPRFGREEYAWGGESIRIDRLDVPDHLVGRELILVAGEGGKYTLYNGEIPVAEGIVGVSGHNAVEKPLAAASSADTGIAGINPAVINTDSIKSAKSDDLEKADAEIVLLTRDKEQADFSSAIISGSEKDYAGAALTNESNFSHTGNRVSDVEIFVSELVARPGTKFSVRRISRLAAIRSIRNNLSTKAWGGGGVIQITLQGRDPVHIQKVLDGLTNTYLRQHVERGSEEAQRSLEFLEGQLPELRAELEAAEERFNAFRRDKKAVDLSADTQNLLAQIVSVETELAQIGLRIVEEGQRFADQHPRMQTLNSQRNRLLATKAALERRVESMPDRQQEVLRLQREVKVATELYTELLNTAQELKVVQAGTIGSVRILDTAVTHESPVKPRRGLTVLLSLMIGLMAGVGLVFGRQALQRTVDVPEDVENALGLPVYTIIPHSKAQVSIQRKARRWRKDRTMPLLARENPQDPAIEGLRSFRTSLHFAMLKQTDKTITITSPHPESGKSFFCINAGHVFMEAGKKVLVIDGDLRRGCLHRYLGKARTPGLSELISGQVEIEDAICSMEDTGLDIMPTGELPPNPSELLMSSATGKIIEDLGKKYDLIIIDSPPMLAVTDAAILGSHSGAMFLLIRSGNSRMFEIEASLKRLQQNDINVTGLLFNDLGSRRTGKNSYSYNHYYRYSYFTDKKE